MKKIFSFLAVLALVATVSSSAFADISIIKSAYASFGEVAMVFDVNLYEWGANKDFAEDYTTTVDSVAFNVSGVHFGNTTAEWAGGTVFAKIHSNLTSQPNGTTVYMYTKNIDNTDGYKANAGKVDGDNTFYRGLVKKGNTTTYQDGDLAPLFVKCTTVSKANTSYKSALPTNFSGENLYAGSRVLVDYSDTGFSTFEDNLKVIGTSGPNGGIWVGYGVPDTAPEGTDPYNWYAGNEDVIMFFGANFDHVTGGAEYGTNKIKFVQSIE